MVDVLLPIQFNYKLGITINHWASGQVRSLAERVCHPPLTRRHAPQCANPHLIQHISSRPCQPSLWHRDGLSARDAPRRTRQSKSHITPSHLMSRPPVMQRCRHRRRLSPPANAAPTPRSAATPALSLRRCHRAGARRALALVLPACRASATRADSARCLQHSTWSCAAPRRVGRRR